MVNIIRQKAIESKRIFKVVFTQAEVKFILDHPLYDNLKGFAQNVYNICYSVDCTPHCVQCDKELKYRDFRRGYGKFCSYRCGNVCNVSKVKETCSKKYGSTSFIGSSQGRDEAKKTYLKKYGCENYQQSDDYKRKVSETWKNKDISSLLEKRKQLNLEKHGEEFFFQTERFKEKARATILARYGVDNAMKSSIIRNKNIETRTRNFLQKLEKDYNLVFKDNYDGVVGYKQYQWECNICKTSFYSCLSIGNRPLCPVCNPRLGTSIESLFEIFLKDNNIKFIKRSRKIISPFEVDFFLPGLNIAFELNGLVWHSEWFGGKGKWYHHNKLILCRKKGIKLITLYEDDILNPLKFDIIKSRILNTISSSSVIKIGARKCILRKVSGTEARLFLNENHLSGYAPSNINYGLYYNDELLYLSTFLHSSKRVFISGNKQSVELVRSCTKRGYSVVGAISRCIKRCYNDLKISILTFSDLDWGYNTSYEKAGFKYLRDTGPGFYFTLNNKKYHRYKFTRKTVSKLSKYDEKKTVLENCRMNNIDRIWNCGSQIFLYSK